MVSEKREERGFRECSVSIDKEDEMGRRKEVSRSGERGCVYLAVPERRVELGVLALPHAQLNRCGCSAGRDPAGLSWACLACALAQNLDSTEQGAPNPYGFEEFHAQPTPQPTPHSTRAWCEMCGRSGSIQIATLEFRPRTLTVRPRPSHHIILHSSLDRTVPGPPSSPGTG